jgi:hypothetical protein
MGAIMLRITKDKLKQLNAEVGKLDQDSGKVFTGFVGRLHMDDRLYHGELRYEDAGETPPSASVSLKAILTPKTKKTVTKTKGKADGDPQTNVGG